MKIYKTLFLFAFISIVFCEKNSAQNETKIVTIIKGEVIDRPNSKNLLLVKAVDDARHNNIATILIIEGKFEYILNSNETEAYQLIFKEEFYDGAWMPIKFFSENATVVFKLNNSESFDKNEINGGKINKIHSGRV